MKSPKSTIGDAGDAFSGDEQLQGQADPAATPASEPEPPLASPPAEEQPKHGGSYVRDPVTGLLTRVEGPELPSDTANPEA